MSIPTDYTFVATYGASIDAEKGGGLLIGTPVGGAAVLSGVLDLAHGDVRYVDYSATYNSDNVQVGAVKFIVIPNYSGTPLHGNVFFCTTEAEGNYNNNIQITHEVTGNIEISIIDSAGTPIVAGTYFWQPVLGRPYELELDYDLTTGIVRLFIDGRFVYENLSATGTRSSSIGILRVGCSWDSISTPATNFSIAKLIIYNAVQHTANYTPGYCLGWVIETEPTLINVFGFIKDLVNISYTQIRIVVSAANVFEYGNLEVYKTIVETTSGTNGYWTIPLIENTSTNVSYTFSFYLNNTLLKQYTDIIIPSTNNCIPFTDLI